MSVEPVVFSPRDQFFPGGHCRRCGVYVGLGGPTAEDATYGYMLIHVAWHAELEGSEPP